MTIIKNPIIDVSHVYFAYNGTPILTDVCLEIAEKEFVAFIGPNGGGKTTLVKLLLGLLKPDRGTIRIMGHPPAKWPTTWLCPPGRQHQQIVSHFCNGCGADGAASCFPTVRDREDDRRAAEQAMKVFK
ncbi:MAG: ATP-binding cassette domain-containing protein [Desulfobacterales bacterium]